MPDGGNSGPPGAALLDGRVVSSTLLEGLAVRIQREGLRPHLHVITAGDDTASQVYVRQKRLAAEKAGLTFSQAQLPTEASLEELVATVRAANADAGIHGIVVQLPLPEALRAHERDVLNLVDPSKDVDCFHPLNYGRLALGEPAFLPATPAGIVRLIQHYGIETRGKLCVVVGKSNIVGKPLGLMLANEEGPAATVVFCDRYTEGIWELTRQADILIVAAGKHHLLRDPKALRADGQATVIDVGIHRVQTAEGKAVVQGDVDAEALRAHCRWLTPVPGGVGPMTVACLLEQVVEAASRLAAPAAALRRAAAGSKLSAPEVGQLMAKLDPSFTQEELAAILQSAGAHCGGEVSLAALVDWAFSPSPT